MTTRESAERDALERWNVGYAHEWPAEIVTADHVAEEQLLADALVITDWLHEAREEDWS